MTKRQEKDATLHHAHQQLLKMLENGYLTREEFAEAGRMLRLFLRPADRASGM